jgi:hypothetical protein
MSYCQLAQQECEECRTLTAIKVRAVAARKYRMLHMDGVCRVCKESPRDGRETREVRWLFTTRVGEHAVNGETVHEADRLKSFMVLSAKGTLLLP